jgi:hypothetical protein
LAKATCCGGEHAAPDPERRGGGFPSADRNNSTLFKLIVDIDIAVEVWPVAC